MCCFAHDDRSAYVCYIWTQKYLEVLIQSVRYLCLISIKFFFAVFSKKIPNIAFRRNAFRRYWVVKWVKTDRRSDVNGRSAGLQTPLKTKYRNLERNYFI